MRRRDLIALSMSSPPSGAPGSGKADGAAPAASLNLANLALPVISGGRLRNYVFVALRLHLGRSAALESVRSKEPFLRDALVRAAHRTPFVVADDWTRLDETAMSASLLRSAQTIVGRGAVTRVEVVSQAPRRRTGVPTG